MAGPYYVRKRSDPAVAPPNKTGLFYFFDGSDAAATDPGAVWTNETNADDSDISTVASTTTNGSSNHIKIEGTNAPGSGGTISSVDGYVFYGAGNVTVQSILRIDTDGAAETLHNTHMTEQTGAWAKTTAALTVPSGGWTWAKVQTLEAQIYLNSGSDLLEIAAIGVMVHTTTEGESAADPFRTIEEAANTVVANTDVWVGAGVYREQVTMDTAGTSGNLIRFLADVDGEQTGDAGLVIITAFDDEQSTASRSYCVDTNEKDFIEWDGFTFIGGTTACVGDLGAGDPKYEGCVWRDCTFLPGPDDVDRGIYVDVNDAATPTGNGPQVLNCVFVGNGIQLRFENNATADRDRKMLVENCVFTGVGHANGYGVFWDQIGGSGSFGSIGLTVNNCSINSFYYGIYTDAGTPASAVTVTNSVIVGAHYAFYDGDGTNKDAIVSDYNTVINCVTSFQNTSTGAHDRDNTTPQVLMGGVADWILYKRLGWSPFLPFEPIHTTDYVSTVIGDADPATASATDLYGSARPMNQDGYRFSTYYFDASDAGPTDEGTVWTNDSNAFNGNTANSATTSTVGSVSTNRLLAEGTTAPTSGGTIQSVDWRFFASSTDATGDTVGRVYENGGSTQLDTFTKSNSPSAGDWTAWQALATHSGGWTWQKVNDLECWFYLSGGTDIGIHSVEIRVTHAAGNDDDRGAVEARALPEQETTTVDVGANAARLEGAGWHDWLVPVLAQSTTITVRARYDSNYTGSLPKMEVLNIPGVADKSDTMVAAANTWETLTSGAFTPTSDGVVRVRFTSQDTSDTGRAFFDAAPTVT